MIWVYHLINAAIVNKTKPRPRLLVTQSSPFTTAIADSLLQLRRRNRFGFSAAIFNSRKKKKKKKIRVTPHSDYLTIFFFFNSEYIYRHRHAGLKEKNAKCFEDLESSISGVKLLGSFSLFLIYWNCCFTQYNRLLVGALLGLRPFLLLNECFYLLQTNVSI